MANMMATLAATIINSHTGGQAIAQATRPFGGRSTVSLPGSPQVPTPSDISRFLKYAEEKLGVKNARVYEGSFKHYHYGPDILHKVPDDKLLAVGLPLAMSFA